MKVVSFNVNGIRARIHQLSQVVADHNPDLIALQEIKCVNDAFPINEITELGYHAEIFGQKGHYGVAILSKKKPVNIKFNFPDSKEDAQKRLIIGTYSDEHNQPFTLINGYFPQGESRDHPEKFPAKEKFYSDLLTYLESDFKKNDNLLIVGDYNVAPEDIDIGIGSINAKRWLKTGKCAFLPEEREWLKRLINWGLYDLFRELYSNENSQLSWFDYRSGGFNDDPKRGLRLDLLLGTEALKSRCKASGIDYKIRGMEKPSDHAPIWAEFK